VDVVGPIHRTSGPAADGRDPLRLKLLGRALVGNAGVFILKHFYGRPSGLHHQSMKSEAISIHPAVDANEAEVVKPFYPLFVFTIAELLFHD
jgi:hypothetical protein